MTALCKSTLDAMVPKVVSRFPPSKANVGLFSVDNTHPSPTLRWFWSWESERFLLWCLRFVRSFHKRQRITLNYYISTTKDFWWGHEEQQLNLLTLPGRIRKPKMKLTNEWMNEWIGGQMEEQRKERNNELIKCW